MKFWNIATDDATGAGIVNIDGEIVTEAERSSRAAFGRHWTSARM